MNSEAKILGGILFASIIILIIGVFFLSKSQPTQFQKIEESRVFPIDYSLGQKVGSDSAKVKLVEFSDFQCPACKAAEPIVQQIIATYPNDVQLIYKHYPLPQHPHAREAVDAAEAAALQGKFWEFHHKLFETQNEWTSLPSPKEYFLNLAKELGLDEAKVKLAMDENLGNPIVEQQILEGQNLTVNSTPTFFINGQKLKLNNFSELKIEIEKKVNE